VTSREASASRARHLRVAPLRQILRDLAGNDFRGYFSLDLFNKAYRARSADEKLKTAMEKIRATVRAALSRATATLSSP
jgi:hypothetical protein